MPDNRNNGVNAANTLIVGALGIVFVTLKLLHKITWSWWWVTAPFWGGLALAVAIILVLLVFLGGSAGFLALTRPRRRRRYR